MYITIFHEFKMIASLARKLVIFCQKMKFVKLDFQDEGQLYIDCSFYILII